MRAAASAAYLLSGNVGDQFLEGVEGFARRLRIAFRQVLHADIAEDAEILVEIHQALQVIDVIDVGVVGMQLDEAVAGGDGGGRFAGLVVGVGDLDLRLLRIAPEGIARFEDLEVLDGLFV
jgi:hypothetical protein